MSDVQEHLAKMLRIIGIGKVTGRRTREKAAQKSGSPQ